jgi:hypothetical protein
MRAGSMVASLAVAGGILLASCDSPTGVVIPRLPDVPPGTILLYDDFDNENGGVGTNNFVDFVNWNVIDGCVDLHGNGFNDYQRGNGLYIDMDGTCDEAGTIESIDEFELPPGGYILEYWLAGNQRDEVPDTVNVALGTIYSEQLVLNPTQQFRLYTRSITVTTETTARLRFQNLGGDHHGALLDVIRLRRAE